ncbi:phospholipase [Lysobacter sp. TY2-98]|uniref:alpha/beta hydrolase n=1 Tax=Lysobacter sp. TY2-98 TaxID=2290922 RepID=UPI000E20178C|nr:phospholipase [Lysobacter sp. TY2-98]AXK72099.1 phospholipase [Lysobacter sp. TY2-98]
MRERPRDRGVHRTCGRLAAMPNSARTPGDLIDAADYAFSHAVLEPQPKAPGALLVLLHGVDGDEQQLVALGQRMSRDVQVVLPRGPRSISGDRIGWYRVGLSDDGLQVVEEEELDARTKLVDFIDQLQSRYGVTPRRTWIGGFSQGGILAASTALFAPDRIAGFFMMAGHLLADAMPSDADAMRALDALIVHGRDDDTLSVDDARDARSRLDAMGVSTTLAVFDAGHTLEPSMIDAAVTWLEAQLRRQ